MWGGMAFGAVLMAAAGVAAAAPRPGQPVAVVMPPWADDGAAITAIAAADARIIAPGAVPWVAIASHHDAGLSRRLYGAGALLVADANFVLACARLIPKAASRYTVSE